MPIRRQKIGRSFLEKRRRRRIWARTPRVQRRILSSLLTAAVLSVLFGAPALAQSAAKARAGARPSSPLGSGKEDDAPPPMMAAPSASQAGVEADRALVRALLFVYEPAPVEIRVLAVEDLALLGDSRALNVLGSLVLDPNPQIQLAAARAVRAFQTPRAEEILENIVRHPRTTDALKLYAVQSLPLQRSPTAREFLLQVMQGEDRFGPQLAQAARNALARAGELPAPGQPSAPQGAPAQPAPGTPAPAPTQMP